MALYGFKNKDAALALKTIGENLVAGNSGEGYPTGMEQMLVKTPSGGIDARAGDTCGEGVCTMVVIDGTDFLEIPSIEVPVLNSTTEAVAADTYVSVSRVGVHWVVSGGGGSGGGEDEIYVIVAASGISAASWTTAGTGTGYIYELSSNGNGWSDTSGGFTIDVRNPWEETISSGSRMICSKKGDYYIVIQASCEPEPETP